MNEIRELDKTYNSGLKVNELSGKKVMGLDGKELGKIIQLRLNRDSLSFDGIEVDRGFFGTDTFIGKDYIESMSDQGAVLNMNPVKDYTGLNVMDLNGKKIGTVKEIRTDSHTNNITAIVVGTGMLNNDVIFTKSDITSVGKNIMLNKAFDAQTIKVGGKSK
jgi:sporulation protein YlmC with PRC-barrel domain